jgi:hypothetical protein
MDQGIWRNGDFQVRVTVRETQALADESCLACKHETIRLVFCVNVDPSVPGRTV